MGAKRNGEGVKRINRRFSQIVIHGSDAEGAEQNQY